MIKLLLAALAFILVGVGFHWLAPDVQGAVVAIVALIVAVVVYQAAPERLA